MIKEHFLEFVIQPDGSRKAEPVTMEKIPTIRQFRYWYGKKYSVKDSIISRKGETKLSLNHRAITGKTEIQLSVLYVRLFDV